VSARRVWTEEAIRQLGVRTDVPTAGEILGLSPTQSYEAVRADRFPVPTFNITAHRIAVPVASILELLHLGDGDGEPDAEPEPEPEPETAGPAVADVLRALADALADAAERLTGSPHRSHVADLASHRQRERGGNSGRPA
jgi:hypothetical protein